MKAILAMANNRCIGKDGKIPWHYSEDLKWFKEFTMDKTIVMGRVTFEELPTLKNRDIVVLTNSICGLDMFSFHSKFSSKCRNLYIRRPYDDGDKLADCFDPEQWPDAIVVGGKRTYELLMPNITEFYVTHINQDYDGDTFMSPFEHFFNRQEVIKQFDFGKIIRYNR